MRHVTSLVVPKRSSLTPLDTIKVYLAIENVCSIVLSKVSMLLYVVLQHLKPYKRHVLVQHTLVELTYTSNPLIYRG